MTDSDRSPGPIAEQTFDRGFKIAICGGLVCVGLLYWIGVLSPASAFHVTLTLALFPVYVVFIAAALAMWLGYDSDETDLQRVTEEVEVESDEP